ncbi:arylsulfatase [Synoicihabitans lomoniglobus]|uniref:Arylsulfatase n=1 Tax=Synoicihabitans lomoniglobus TaxID=2909285 RepID=A0AAF0I1Q5_9BACT|nr:arylsulfatase [Opitutaceae bacterium LMO-M01]WED65952.1 arylsulfatase [Opitutaceae bacterium LMO-M01]
MLNRLLCFCALIASAAAAVADRPNIIYILADDLGYGDLGCYGQKKFATPHLDQLAARGMRFTQHYAGSTVCAPSRSALMTGQHTGHTAIRGNSEVQPEGQHPLPPATTTLAELLQHQGYRTGLFGKWGLGAPGSGSEPIDQGFDRFFGYNCQRQAHHYYPYFLWDDDQRVMLWRNFDRATGTYAPALIQEKALNFIDDAAAAPGQPFFLFYAHVAPHAEMAATATDLTPFRGQFEPETPFVGTDSGPRFRQGPYGSQPEPRATFAAMVTMLDRHVGEIVAKLDALGLSDNTLILFSSDNGPHLEGGHDPDYFDSNGPLRGYKRDLYEGGIRVPLIAHWPGKIPAAHTSDHISAQWDLLPTFCELAGVTPPTNIDGISLVPELTHDKSQVEHDLLYWEFHDQGGRMALRQGDWKVVRYNVDAAPDSPVELYDLAHDPGETADIAADHPAIASRLDNLMKNARVPATFPRFNFR